MIPPLNTGQTTCHDSYGHLQACKNSVQDAEYSLGIRWPEPRFKTNNGTVLDELTGLYWSQDANIGEFPMFWQEALDYIKKLNQKEYLGFSDWRLPNRRELRSLMSYQTRKPALPENNPFTNVFLGWYWSSTTALISPSHAWTVHMEGARMFYGGKDQSYLVWPVRGQGNGNLMQTGQTCCYDEAGEQIACKKTGQDGELQIGAPWPTPRFINDDNDIKDNLTGLVWSRNTDLTSSRCTWDDAFKAVKKRQRETPEKHWRLPNINELESLVDCSQHSPALPADYPFSGSSPLKDGYWSSTTSLFEPDWAWVLYLDKGATGVGYKPGKHFHVWLVHS